MYSKYNLNTMQDLRDSIHVVLPLSKKTILFNKVILNKGISRLA